MIDNFIDKIFLLANKNGLISFKIIEFLNENTNKLSKISKISKNKQNKQNKPKNDKISIYKQNAY